MMVATVILMRAERAEDLLLGAAVTGTAPTVLNANGANQKRFDESLLVRAGMKSQRARTNIFLWNDRSGRHENRPERRLKTKEKNFVFHRSGRHRDATVISSEELAQFRLIRPIRVQTCWSRPDDRGELQAAPPLPIAAFRMTMLFRARTL